MIIKTLSRKSGTKQIVNYLFKDKEKLSNEKFKPMVLRHNVRSRSLEKIVKEFESNHALRKVKRKDSPEIFHSILSFSNLDKEKVTEKMMKDIAKKYVELRGKDNMFLITHHVEKDHVHLHCVMSATKYLTGKSSSISKAEFAKLKVEMQAYQKTKYPELSNSLPKHGKERGYAKDKRATQKVTLETDIKTLYESSKSKKAFLDELQKLGHEPYYRNEKLTGIKYQGDLKYRFTKLGYEPQKLEALDERVSEEKQKLDDLENLRAGSKDRERESTSRDRFIDEEDKDDQEIELENEHDDDYSR
jgi:hypothetical protein